MITNMLLSNKEMKSFIISILLVLYAGTVVAQDELKVKSFIPSISDLTASTQARKDGNDNFCALVKVVISDSDVAFEGMIIGDVSFHTNEYWIYLTTGERQAAKHLKIKHPKYQTIDVVFADYGFSTLQPRTTYMLVLQKPKETNLEYKYNRIGAAFTSLVIPGLGQMAFKSSYKKGILIFAGEVAAVGGIFICNSQSNEWKNKSDMAITATDKKDFMAKSDGWANARTICIGAAVVTWTYNMVDVLFSKKNVNRKSNSLSVQPFYDFDKNYGVSMAYTF